jgi:hypothetical protein
MKSQNIRKNVSNSKCYVHKEYLNRLHCYAVSKGKCRQGLMSKNT